MIGLKVYVGGARLRTGVTLGLGDDARMLQATRVQGNAVEDVPPLMVGLAVLGAAGAPAWQIHALGGVLLVSRLLHAQGLASSPGRSFGRGAGTLGTLLVQLGMAAALIAAALGAAPRP
jgi:hypothetical protein